MNENVAVDTLPTGHELFGSRYQSSVASLTRARRPGETAWSWIKSPNGSYPVEAVLKHIEAELKVAERSLHGPAAKTRVDAEKTCWLLYEQHAGEPLQVVEPWNLDEFLPLARALTRALDASHARGLFFGLLEPTSVLWQREGEVVGLVGAIAYSDREVVRTLANSPYVAPELSARADVDITLAADIYSLGCIFYALLMGRPALAEQGSSELERRMHPIAPLPAEQLPEGLTQLIMSMLAASPERRPNTAAHVLEALGNLHGVRKSTNPAPQFSVRRLVARHDELAALTAAIERAQSGEGALLVVSGEPGVGKSTLLSDAKKWTLSRNRIVAEGKFDQVRRDQPYSALLRAFRSTIELLLGDDDAQYDRHRDRFAAADRALLGVLRSALPELEHVAGRLPLPPRLGPSETEYRFKRAFRYVLECFCDPSQPLLLVLDDLQWADRATIEVLKDWQQLGLPQAFALVCCHRTEAAGLPAYVQELLSPTKVTLRLELEPFELAGVTALCQEVLPECDSLPSLSELVHARSGGNPLHAIEVVKNLVANGELLREGGRWRLKRPQARLTEVSDTVVDLLVNRIRRFSDPTRRALMAGACIGQDFSPVLLAAALGQDTGIGEALRTASREGLLVRATGSDDSYAFAHDRTQQAALSLADDSFRTEVRLRLGRHYLKAAATNRQCLLDAVEYLNLVRNELHPTERTELASLNWQAALSAKETIAYERAVALLRAYLEDAAELDDESRFSAEISLAECLFLSQDIASSQRVLVHAERLATSDARKVRLAHTSLLLSQHLQQYRDAIQAGLSALRVLNYRLPSRPGLPRVLIGLARLMLRARKVDPKQLALRNDHTDQRDRSILDILVTLWGPTFWEDQNLNAIVVIHLMNLTLHVGNTPHAAMAYVCFAVLNHVVFKRYEVARSYGQLAMARLETEGSAFVATRVRFLALTFFGAFERTPVENVRAYEQALTECIANGELVGSHLLDGIITTLPVHGFSLATVQADLNRHQRQARLLGARSTIELVGIVERWHSALSDRGVSSLNELTSLVIEHKSYHGVRDLLAMQLAYLWHDDDLVLRLAARTKQDMVVQANPLHCGLFCLLELLARCRKLGRPGRRERAHLATLKRFAQIHPDNFLSSQLLAEAAVLAARGETLIARERYRQAIYEAARHGHELFGAMAAEQLALSYDSGPDKALRDDCLRAAAFGYARFGARAKSAQLKTRYPDLTSWRSSSDANGMPSVDLELDAVMRAAHAIAEVTSSDRLAPTLTRVIATAVGAERAVLIQKVREQWTALTSWQSNVGEGLSEPVPLEVFESLAIGVVRYVCRTNTVVRLGGEGDQRFVEEAYLNEARPRSVLCVPLAHRGEVNAAIYLENSLYDEAFTEEQQRLVTLLGTQAAIALANADNQRLQVEAVQSRVNPHFLYNALSVVTELIATSPERAEAVVLKLSRLYRSMLSSSADRMVTLREELDLIRDYLDLESARFGDKFSVSWQLDDELDTTRIPSLLLQPLVENAVHHGIRRKLERGVVSISAQREGGSLQLRVSDDGPGWYRSEKGNGFGLRSVEKRLKLLYGDSAQMTITRGRGVTVQLRLPLS